MLCHIRGGVSGGKCRFEIGQKKQRREQIVQAGDREFVSLLVYQKRLGGSTFNVFYFLVIQLRFCNTYRPCDKKFERASVVNELVDSLSQVKHKM
jgi:hypothetical protein